MRRTLTVFILPAGKPAGTPPEPGPTIELGARNDDALRAVAHEVLAQRGQRIRALSCTPTGLVAYAEVVS